MPAYLLARPTIEPDRILKSVTLEWRNGHTAMLREYESRERRRIAASGLRVAEERYAKGWLALRGKDSGAVGESGRR